MMLPQAIERARSQSRKGGTVAVYQLSDATGIVLGYSNRLASIVNNRRVEKAVPILWFKNGRQFKNESK